MSLNKIRVIIVVMQIPICIYIENYLAALAFSIFLLELISPTKPTN